MFSIASLQTAFASPVTVWLVEAVGIVVFIGLVVISGVSLTGRVGPALRRELWLRLGSWVVLLPLMIGPVLAGRAWTIGAVTVLGLLCLREFSRATGLFRQPTVHGMIVAGVLAVNFAALDHWYGFFVALPSLTIVLISVVSIPQDRPAGYIQRTGLAVFAFMLFGSGLAHLGYMANDLNYRPIVLMLLLCVALNDVLAFTVGKILGGPKLIPHTSPGKTVSGAIGALVLIAPLVAFLGHRIFLGTAMDRVWLLLFMGALLSIAAQAGDLVLSSIKRDLGIKDMGVLLPGHGGILDRYNSLLLVAPAMFHLIGYYVGFGLDQPVRLMTGP
jgi:phosphatidate cytidylyltransferase